jgi:hypothetical protein
MAAFLASATEVIYPEEMTFARAKSKLTFVTRLRRTGGNAGVTKARCWSQLGWQSSAQGICVDESYNDHRAGIEKGAINTREGVAIDGRALAMRPYHFRSIRSPQLTNKRS